MDIYNRYYNTSLESDRNAYVACATTGKAAVVIGGVTVHSAFKLSTTGEGGIRDGDLNSFRLAFRHYRERG